MESSQYMDFFEKIAFGILHGLNSANYDLQKIQGKLQDILTQSKDQISYDTCLDVYEILLGLDATPSFACLLGRLIPSGVLHPVEQLITAEPTFGAFFLKAKSILAAVLTKINFTTTELDGSFSFSIDAGSYRHARDVELFIGTIIFLRLRELNQVKAHEIVLHIPKIEMSLMILIMTSLKSFSEREFFTDLERSYFL